MLRPTEFITTLLLICKPWTDTKTAVGPLLFFHLDEELIP